MRRFIQLITSKKILGAVFLLIQLAMFYLGFYALREYSLYILGGEKIIGAVAIITIVALVILSEGDIGDVGELLPDFDLPTIRKNRIKK